VVLLTAAVAAYFLVVPPPPAPVETRTETVTPPPPSPTVPPSPKESGTDFYNQIPDTVGAYVLVTTAPSPEFEELKAYDAYTLTYTDGSHEVTVQAGQWRTEAAATDAFNALGGPEGWPGAEVDLTATVCPPAVKPDQKALWRNLTAIFAVDAPDAGAAEFFCRMPM
jgi:hypothetical protein